MKTISLKLATVILAIIISSCQGNSKAETTSSKENTSKCMTCNKIEALTLETLKNYPELQFKLINVDDAKNEKIAEQFEATGTSLFLYNPVTKNKLNLTEFAFMTAGDEAKFSKELKIEIDKFVK